MIARAWRGWRELNRADFLSPKALLLWAARFTLLLAVLHLAGWREHTTVLSGTVMGQSAALSQFFGLCYLVAYFTAVLGVPPLLIAAGLSGIAQAIWRRRHPLP
jgi:hypothetical protein